MRTFRAGLKTVTVATLAALCLTACASENAPKSVKSETPITIEIVPQYDTDPKKAIGTNHLPKKTIQTPWGPKEIPDQSKNPELIKLFNRLSSDAISYRQSRQYELDLKNIRKYRLLQNKDIARSGCYYLMDSTCEANTIIFTKDCGKNHWLGKKQLSQCEKNNSRWIHRPAVAWDRCTLNQQPHIRFDEWDVSRMTQPNAISDYLNHECKIWRGDGGWGPGSYIIETKEK